MRNHDFNSNFPYAFLCSQSVHVNDAPTAVFSASPPLASELPAVPYDIVADDNEGLSVRDVVGKTQSEPPPRLRGLSGPSTRESINGGNRERREEALLGA